MTRAKLHLTFPEHLISEPVIQRIGTEFGLVNNVHQANLAERGGWVILEVDGEPDRVAEAIGWLTDQGRRSPGSRTEPRRTSAQDAPTVDEVSSYQVPAPRS